MEIGSHGCSHRALTALSFDEMKDELKRSKETLENIINRRVTLLALPHGFGSRVIERAAREAGYDAICTSRFGLNERQHGSYYLNRIGLKGPTGWVELEKLLQEGSAPYRRQLLLDRVKGLGKRVLQTHKRCD
jgi:peptidoglycan/xylan/chitin deacetylase (PgdA/CDA1 family)